MASAVKSLQKLIKKLEQLKASLLKLAPYRQRTDAISVEMGLTESNLFGMTTEELENTLSGKEYDPVTGPYYEAYRTNVKRELQQAKDRIAKGPIEDSVAKLRNQIAVDLVPFDDLIRSNSLSGGDDFLCKITAIVRDSINPEDITKLITELKVINKRAEKKPTQTKTEKERLKDQATPTGELPAKPAASEPEVIVNGGVSEQTDDTEKTKDDSDAGSPAKKQQLDEIKPIKVKGLWNVKRGSFEKLRKIDSNPNRSGIPGTKKERNRLKYYLRKYRKRPDVAGTLYWIDGRIKTKMDLGRMFSEE